MTKIVTGFDTLDTFDKFGIWNCECQIWQILHNFYLAKLSYIWPKFGQCVTQKSLHILCSPEVVPVALVDVRRSVEPCEPCWRHCREVAGHVFEPVPGWSVTNTRKILRDILFPLSRSSPICSIPTSITISLSISISSYLSIYLSLSLSLSIRQDFVIDNMDELTMPTAPNFCLRL